MHLPRRFVLVLLGGCVLLHLVGCKDDSSASSAVQTPPAADATPTSGERVAAADLPWIHDDYAAALALAKKETKPIVVDLWAPWCHTCISMQKTVFTKPQVLLLKDKFVWLAMDTDKPVNAEGLKNLYITAWPTFYVLSPDEKTLARHVGGASLQELVTFLKDGLAAQGGMFQEDSAGALATVADRAAATADHAEAAEAYRKALDAAGPQAADRFALRVDLAASLYKLDKASSCLSLAEEGWKDQAQATSAAGPDFVSLIIACVAKGDENEIGKKTVLQLKKRALEKGSPLIAVLDNPKADLSADDRSDALRILRELFDELGEKEQAKKMALKQRKVLDDAVAGLKDPELIAGYAWPREEVYVYLGQGNELVEELTASVKALPDSYDPPYRLAWLLNKIGKPDEALPHAKDALDKVYGPRKIRAWHLLASVEAERKDVSGERAAWEGMKKEVAALPEGHRMKSSGKMAEENLARLDKADG